MGIVANSSCVHFFAQHNVETIPVVLFENGYENIIYRKCEDDAAHNQQNIFSDIWTSFSVLDKQKPCYGQNTYKDPDRTNSKGGNEQYGAKKPKQKIRSMQTFT